MQALEPFFSVLLSAIFLGDKPTVPIVLSLFPIVGGVAMASITEATFNWGGFLSAMGSNVTFQSRNVLSKKFMGKDTKVLLFNPYSIQSNPAISSVPACNTLPFAAHVSKPLLAYHDVPDCCANCHDHTSSPTLQQMHIILCSSPKLLVY